MIITSPQPSLKNASGMLRASNTTRFGNVGVAGIKNLKNAERIYNRMGKKLSKFDVQRLNLSLEDWAGRFLTVFGVYIPQAYYSIKENKHIVETNARNALVWAMTLAIYIAMKNENVGLNSIFNQFMKPKVENPSGVIEKLTNRLRIKSDYFDLLKGAGIKYSDSDKKKMYWTKLENNHTDKLSHVVDDLADEITIELKKSKKTDMDIKQLGKLVKKEGAEGVKKISSELDDLVPKINKMQDIKRFLVRRGAFSLINTAVISAALVYLVGGVAMKIVLNTVAPLDHDFVPPKDQNLNNPIYKWIMRRKAQKSGKMIGDLEGLPYGTAQHDSPARFNSPYPEQGYPLPSIKKSKFNQLNFQQSIAQLSLPQKQQLQQAMLQFQASQSGNIREGQL